MITIRPLAWPADRAALLVLDTSFVTDQVYQVRPSEQAFTLAAVPVAPPLRKVYPLSAELDSLPSYAQVLVVEDRDALVGMAALRLEAWNRRAVLEHFYIAPAQRGRGLGRALMQPMIEAAQALGARCLWLETQSINYAAIGFYRRLGFQWCGLDTSLYDRQSTPADEIALFFVRQLSA